MTGRRPPAAASQPGTAEPAIVVMAKAPRPGLAKTRLFPLLGQDGAAALQTALITHTVTWAASVATTFVAVDPPDARADVPTLTAATLRQAADRLVPLRDLDTPEDAHALLDCPGLPEQIGRLLRERTA